MRRPKQLAFTETEAGTIVKSPPRKLAETIASRNGLPSLPNMISMGVVPSGQVDLVVKGKSHDVYLFPDGVPPARWLSLPGHADVLHNLCHIATQEQ